MSQNDGTYSIFPETLQHKKKSKSLGLSRFFAFLMVTSMGATANSLGGARFSLYLNHDHFFFCIIGSGPSTNMRDELLSLLALLFIATSMGIPNLHVWGDSYVIINWMNSKATPTPLNLEHWCNGIFLY